MQQPTLFPLPEIDVEAPDGPLSASLTFSLSWLPDGSGAFQWTATTPDQSHCRSTEILPSGSSPHRWEGEVRRLLDAYLFPGIDPF